MDGVSWLLLAAMVSAGHCFPEKIGGIKTNSKRNAIFGLGDLGRDARKGNNISNILELYLSKCSICFYHNNQYNLKLQALQLYSDLKFNVLF